MARPRANKPSKASPKPPAASSATVPPGLVCLGAFAGARGVKGEVRIKAFTEDPESVAAYGPVRDLSGREFTLEEVRVYRDGLLARVRGLNNREEAEALKGTAFYVARAALPPSEDDGEFYYADLEGLRADHEDGTAFGTVRAVHDFGAGDLLEIALAETGRRILFPFTREAVPVVDIEGGRVVVVPPPGLLNEEGGAAEEEEAPS